MQSTKTFSITSRQLPIRKTLYDLVFDCWQWPPTPLFDYIQPKGEHNWTNGGCLTQIKCGSRMVSYPSRDELGCEPYLSFEKKIESSKEIPGSIYEWGLQKYRPPFSRREKRMIRRKLLPFARLQMESRSLYSSKVIFERNLSKAISCSE